MRNKFLQGPVESNTYEDKVYGVPWFTDAGLLYYRKDLVEKAGFSGPPATWDELKEQANQIMQDEGTKFGFVFQGAEYEGGTVKWWGVLTGHQWIMHGVGYVEDPTGRTQVVRREATSTIKIQPTLASELPCAALHLALGSRG